MSYGQLPLITMQKTFRLHGGIPSISLRKGQSSLLIYTFMMESKVDVEMRLNRTILAICVIACVQMLGGTVLLIQMEIWILELLVKMSLRSP